MLFSFFALFIGICLSRPSTAGRNEVLKYNAFEARESILREGGVYRGKSQDFCNVNSYGNTTASYTVTTWNTNLIIVSRVSIPIGQSLTSVGFLVSSQSQGNSNNGLVDILVFNSTGSAPGVLAAKIPAVNLSAFVNGSFTCLPVNINTASDGNYWIGFYGQTGYGKSVIPRSPTNAGSNYYYQFISTSPSLGQGFPINGYSGEPFQLVVGATYGQQSCSALSCSSCTYSLTCAWCLSTGSCIANSQIPQCRSWTRNPAVCPACGYNTCNQCVGASNCAWCITNGQPSGCVLIANDGNCTTAITEPSFCGI